MNVRWVKFLAALALFLAWLGWLGYLVAHQSREVILSRPQILAADYLVVAHVEPGPDGKPEQAQVLKAQQVLAGADDTVAPGKPLFVDDLNAAAGFTGAGDYLLPVSWGRGEGLVVTPIPRSPGYDPFQVRTRPPIYPWTAGTEAQLRGIRPQ
jgi:hypothetical protein